MKLIQSFFPISGNTLKNFSSRRTPWILIVFQAKYKARLLLVANDMTNIQALMFSGDGLSQKNRIVDDYMQKNMPEPAVINGPNLYWNCKIVAERCTRKNCWPIACRKLWTEWVMEDPEGRFCRYSISGWDGREKFKKEQISKTTCVHWKDNCNNGIQCVEKRGRGTQEPQIVVFIRGNP